MSLNQMKKSITLWFWFTAFIWTAVVAGSLVWNGYEYSHNIEQFALQEANTRFDDIIIAREWNARHNGLYGQVDQQTQPNPYLEGVVKERDITTPSGTQLTLVNPAYMTRQLNELLEKRLGLSAHLTSLKPLRPANAADAWETRSLQSFEQGTKEVHQIVELNGRSQMRLMRPLITTKACLQCHARQGYKEGEIRGGLSVAVPMASYTAAADINKRESGMWHGLIWLLGLFGLGFGRRKLDVANLKCHQAQERFKLVFDHSSDAIFIHTTSGNIESANREGMNMFGYSHMEFQQMQLFDLYAESSQDDAKDLFERCQRDGQVRFETVFRKRDGTDFPAEVSASLFEHDRGGLIQASIRDITKRKLAEKRIHLLSRSLEQTNEAILITDPNGNLEFVNAAFSKVTGYAPDEVIGKNPRLLSSGEQNSAFYADMWAKISRGEPWQGRVIDRKRDGSFYPSLLAISPVLDDDGVIINFIGIQQDMTAYDDLKAQFLQAQKMEAVGTLVGGIAHDFNNMLAGLTGNLYLVKNRVKDDPYLVHRLDTMEDLSSHAANMIKQLLGFSRKGCISMQQLDLTSFLKEALKLIAMLVPEAIVVDEHICNQRLQIEGDVTQLHQVILNIVNNARDALEGVKEPGINITLEPFHADAAFINTHPYFVVGDYALLSIADNGSGISEEHIQQIYEPFFTTKAQDKGTGLGLAMVYGTIKTHQGFIDVESSECEGTTFHIYLPVSTDQQTEQASSEAEPAMGKGETILLVDDQQYIVNTGKSVLESLGYQVRVAENGQQAVNIVKKYADIDLIIMDIVMPEMGGKDAAAEVRKLQPLVQIIFATGYDEDTEPDMKDELLISKPFSIAELSHMIRKQLDR